MSTSADAEEDDELVPVVSAGGPKVERPADPAGSGFCRGCPFFDKRAGWCPVRAVRRAGLQPMCRYGAAAAAQRTPGKREAPEKG